MRVWVIALVMSLTAIAGCVENGESNDIDSHVDCMEDDQMVAASEAPADEAETNETVDDNSTSADEADSNDTVDDNATAANETEADSDAMDHEDHMDACPADEVTTMAGAYLTSDVLGGEAPIDVFFQFGVTEIPQDEFLTWTLDADADGTPDAEGNGNNLEGNYTFTYANAGNYNVTFSATDGIDVWNATVAIAVTEPAPAEGEEGEGEGDEEDAYRPPVEQAHEGNWLTDSPRCSGGPSGTDGVTYSAMVVDELTYGQKFFAAFEGGLLVAAMVWLDADGAEILTQEDTDEGEYYEITGTVPKGAAAVHFYSCATPAIGSVAYTTPVS